MANIIVIDCETSGLDPLRHSILSIGSVYLMGKGKSFYGECNAWDGAEIDDKALEVNGFRREDITSGVNVREEHLIKVFTEYLPKKYILAGMNPSFDLSFLKAAAARAGLKIRFPHRTIDMHTLAITWAIKWEYEIPETGFYTDAIYDMIGMEAEVKPHNALTGAQMEKDAIERILNI